MFDPLIINHIATALAIFLGGVSAFYTWRQWHASRTRLEGTAEVLLPYRRLEVNLFNRGGSNISPRRILFVQIGTRKQVRLPVGYGLNDPIKAGTRRNYHIEFESLRDALERGGLSGVVEGEICILDEVETSFRIAAVKFDINHLK